MESNSTAHSRASSPSRGSHYSDLSDGESQTSVSEAQTPVSHPELDGDHVDPIAICGFSIKFPQDATSPDAFWNMVAERRCAMTDFPADRLNLDGFYRKKNKLNTLPLRGGHFVRDELPVFDADFFSISPTEATSMDPMQRWLLEAAYRALENAGISMESISGSSTAVYTGSFSLDYMLQLNRDPECPPTYAALGFGLSMLANRLSWFFNLRGPSIGLDSACSSTAMAIDIACQALRNGSCDMAMVAGCNLAYSPESYAWMSNINFLSADSRCHSFDHRANGYARGEGVGVMILKRVPDAVRDGSVIRAVIRSAGSNEDGRTPGITQPSRAAQERLIRDTYAKAGLSMAHTRFFEAHGTGTPIGDPREAQAIGSAFQKHRSPQDPLYVGAVKSNIGHLEGASGLAAVIKAVLVLEKGVIPPNTNFERLNPKIDAQFLRLRFPQKCHPWPTAGLRRASVNSFGYGGSNSHIVLDDAYNYLRLRSLPGRHCTAPSPPGIASIAGSENDEEGHLIDSHRLLPLDEDAQPRLLVWSAADKNGIDRFAEAYREWHHGASSSSSSSISSDESLVANLAFTLDSHRSHLPWRSFALLRSATELSDLPSRMAPPLRAPQQPPRLGFVFSGQGAQWFAMGRELVGYSSFKAELERAGCYLKSVGCRWSVMDELQRQKDTSNIDRAEFSQALCTVLQVALVNLLRRFGVRPAAVVGHSSGEIAAAYAGGYLSCESAWRLAYFRGLCSSELSETAGSGPRGAMMSVGLPEDGARDEIAAVQQEGAAFGLTVACINSPGNVTVSGEERLVGELKARLDARGVFARELRVPLAYHSRQMEAISAKYVSLIGQLPGPDDVKGQVPMISSVTGERVTASRLADPSYWALNMESPVRFSQAVAAMCAQSSASLVKKIDGSHAFASVVDHLVELGPHAALQGPIRDILRASPRGESVGYSSVLRRGQSAVETTLRAMGELHSMGLAVNLRVANEPTGEGKASRSLLVDLPEYPFDHSQRYWHESRLSRGYRLRSHAPSELLGARSSDWNATDARWRHFIRAAEMPWVTQHVVNGSTLYPGAGMLAMAIEAAKQLAGEAGVAVDGYTLRDVHILGPIDLTANSASLEVQTSLRRIDAQSQDDPTFEFAIRTYTDQDEWLLNCRGLVSAELSPETSDSWEREKTMAQRQEVARHFSQLLSSCEKPVESQHMYAFLKRSGYDYGSLFQAAQQQRCSGGETKSAAAKVALFSQAEEDHVVHPVSLDAILHLAFTALTSGGAQPMATSVPSRIGCLWVSAVGGLSWPEQQTVTACCTIDNITRRGFSCRGAVLDSTSSSGPRLWYEDFELTNVTDTPAPFSLPNPKQFCMSVECKVALDKLDLNETQSLLDELHPAEQVIAGLSRDLGLLVELALDRLTSCVNPASLDGQEPWKRRYWSWTEHHLASCRRTRLSDDPDSLTHRGFRELCDHLEDASNIGRLYAKVAANLVGIFSGELDAHELLQQSGLLEKYHDELINQRCAKQAASYIDLLAHQTPGLNILEVGGGNDSVTHGLVSALLSGPADHAVPGSLRCSRYDVAHASSAVVDRAREDFAAFHSQMTLEMLDMERDLAEQGFHEGAYDVVVVDSVLCAASDVAKTLQSVRKVLKPGGKLLVHELLVPSGLPAGFVFGLLPGWWHYGQDDHQPLSSDITVEAWDAALKNNDFSGADMVFQDSKDGLAHHGGWLVSTAADEAMSLSALPQLRRQATIVVDQTSTQQQSLAVNLLSPLQDLLGQAPRVLDIEAAASANAHEQSPDELVIFLADYGPSFLASLTETTWSHLKSLVESSRHLLWVSAGGGQSANPDHGMLDGLARTLRSEYYELHLVTLALDASNQNADKAAPVMKVVREMASRAPHQGYEQEYVVLGGRLHTRRLVEAARLKADMDARLVPFKAVLTPLDGKLQFEMVTAASAGVESTPHYVESSAIPAGDPEGDDIDIEVRAVALEPWDRAAVLGLEQESKSGSFYAGVVLRAGPEAAVHPGNRVVAAYAGSLRSHARVSSRALAEIPPHVSFADACATVPPMVTAHRALVQEGRVGRGDSVLVHGGASPVGQAALRLLADEGVTDVWATAASQDESFWIAENQGIPEERIVPGSWFDGRLMASQWRQKFDVVFSTRADSTSSSLVSHASPGGRCVMLSNSSQQIHRAPSSVPLSVVQLGTTQQVSCTTTAESLRYSVATMSQHSTLKDARHQAAQFAASDLAGAFSHLRNADDGETVVVKFDEADVVDVRIAIKPAYMLNPEATYLIVGGLGGLGRVMARWLASRGARHLILLSRSGPRTPEARQLVAELEAQRVRVETPPCDVTDQTVLRSVLASCAERMPPIRGCIQASMVMTELIFQKMGFDSWKATVDSKVAVSRNLDSELTGELDFFILISSVMGILGSGSLAAYNAGNTYQDALARHRATVKKERAVSLDLGGVVDDGYLARHGHQRLRGTAVMALMYARELCALLDVYCDPRATSGTHSRGGEATGCQAVVGIRPPAHWRHADEVPATLAQPFWGHMHHVPALTDLPNEQEEVGDAAVPGLRNTADAAERLAAASSLAEAAEVAAEALAARVSALLGTAADRLDAHKPMHSYGIDSLSAVELRSWAGRAFDVDLPVFEILGGATFASAGMSIARRVHRG